ncbi:MAG: FtsW/RodA/SpoVE family cell cycle protein [Lachnospiraceae bacterium]
MLKRYSIRNYNFRLVIYLVALAILGILVIGSAKEGNNQTRQIMGLILGLGAMVVVSLIDYSFILRFVWIFYGLDLVLLAAVIAGFGENHKGATRWIEIFGIQFQPSELSKIILILFFAAFLQKHREKINSLKTLVCFAVLAAVPLFLVLKEPDLSTTIVTALICLSLLFIGGLSYKIVMGGLAVAVPSLLVALYMIASNPGAEDGALEGYQNTRILAWLYPELYPQQALQTQNSIMAIGSGQLSGKGLYNTDVTSIKSGGFIAEAHTDFIFTVVGEELGFIGSAAIVILMLLIALECLWVARRAKDLSGRLICCGMAALIGFQSFVNICVVTGLFPNTGVTLPFVSYGLTSLVTNFAGMGFVLNVGLQPRKYGTGENT